MATEGMFGRSRVIDQGLAISLIVIMFAAAVMKATGALPPRPVALSLIPWGLGTTLLTCVGLLASGYRTRGLFYLAFFLQVLIASVIGVLVAYSLARMLVG